MTTGILHLGPGVLRVVPYHRWTAFIGPATCTRCGATDGYVHWAWVEPGRSLTLCEECSDGYNLMASGAVLRRAGHPDDGPGETF